MKENISMAHSKESNAEHWDLYMNGVYQSVLGEILNVHKDQPDQLLYMQPHRPGRIAKLRDNPPTEGNPIKMWISTTDDLQHVSYVAEIVGWEDKTEISEDRRSQVKSVIDEHQPGERGMLEEPEKWGVNLLSVRRMVKINEPFSVSQLVKINDGKPLATTRTRSGGHSYVRMGKGTDR